MLTDLTTDLLRAPFGALLSRFAEEDDDVVVLAADLARYVDVLGFAERFPDRFLQMGMSEQNAIGVTSGLAKSGLLPVFVTYGVFITRRAYDQVAMALCTGPTRALLVGAQPGIATPFRATHQSIDDVALMRALPGMTVIDPADATDMAMAFEAVADGAGPVYVRSYRGSQPPLPRPQGDTARIGDTVDLGDGDDVAFVSTGLATQWVLQARTLLRDRGISVAHLHVPTIKPLDREAIADFCADRASVICVENHTRAGGLFEAVAGVLAETGTGTRLRVANVPDVWPPSGSTDHIRRELRLDPEALATLAQKEAR